MFVSSSPNRKRSLAVSATASIVVFAVSAILSGDGVVVSKSDGDGMASSCSSDRIGDTPGSHLGASKTQQKRFRFPKPLVYSEVTLIDASPSQVIALLDLALNQPD